jgi:Pup amidohydrolase
MSIESQKNSSVTGHSDVAPKILGADVELGNFILGRDQQYGSAAAAARALLREIPGVPSSPASVSGSWLYPSDPPSANPQDWGRKYLAANGGCVYIDLDHLECCTPEVLSAFDFAAAHHAMLRIARAALRAANTRLPQGEKIVAVVNNEDGQGHSYGSHLSLQMTRAGWDRLFHRRLDQLLMLASFQVSSLALTGQGKVSSGENPDRGARGFYELSQRASFIQCLVGPQTTYNRPLVNSRDEALCGRFTALGCPADRFARLHCIFYDSTLCPSSIVLRAGMMQILLCILESPETNADLKLMLEDPVATVSRWSRDLTLTAPARLLTGETVTAIELQRRFFELAARFVEDGGCEGAVPAARDILALWADTLDKLSRGDLSALASRLDWVLKLQLLEHAMQQQPDLKWSSPAIKHLDFKYADLEEGLFWACYQADLVENAGVTENRIQRFSQEPPENTRAWTRAHLLRRADPATVADVDWDKITFKFRSQHGMERKRTVALANPLAFARGDTEVVFRRSENLEEILDLLGAPASDPDPLYTTGGYSISADAFPASSPKYLPSWSNRSDHDEPTHLRP